jgi:hypothetical protein
MALSFTLLGCGSDYDMPDNVKLLIRKGEYTKAIEQLQTTAQQATADNEREFFAWEAERLRRIQRDYDLTCDDLRANLNERIMDYQEKELEQWQNEGRFDWRIIDGEPRYLSPSVSNLFFRYPDMRSRQKKTIQKPLIEILNEIIDLNDDNRNSTAFLPSIRFHIKMSLTVKPNVSPSGETIRCWLPFPQENSFQTNVRVLSSSPAFQIIAPPNASHRSVYFEQKTMAEKPASFTLEYEYTSIPRLETIDPKTVTDAIPDEVKPYIRETPPHVVFLPEFESLVEQIVGDETNPYHVARKIYLWISHNFKYSYAREYSTIRNISRYTYRKRYGDCGQLALLYITLCRMKGIPARWESGWMLYPGAKNLHDWCVIYLDSYGWTPVDPNMGVAAVSAEDSFDKNRCHHVMHFFFGHMDPYRLVVNSNHGETFVPSKKQIRSDTVDFQRGEVETWERNIYYNNFSYNLEILDHEVIKTP